MHCVDLGESFPTHVYLQNLASIQLRTSPSKLDSQIVESATQHRRALRDGALPSARPDRVLRAARGVLDGLPALQQLLGRRRGRSALPSAHSAAVAVTKSDKL